MTAPAIAAEGLTKRFGRAAALQGVDLQVAPGASLAVLGPNGAGKSTLLRLVAGLVRPSAGSVTVAGAAAGSRAARARIGFIAHAIYLYPALTARENLVFAARLHAVPNPGARADALLEDEGLAAVANRPAGGFSRGVAQRLAIARGLVHAPEVVLLDEPFTGLDHAAAERLTDRLGRLHGDGRTLILVTHDVARAAALAQRAIVLAGGRIVHEADAGDAGALERAYAGAEEAGR